jgi:hypothetical protein
MAKEQMAYTRHSLSSIPAWMTTIDYANMEVPVPSMEGPGMPSEWETTWKRLRISLERQSRAVQKLQEQIQNSSEARPQSLIDWMGQLTMEPIADLQSIFIVETKRGLLFMLAPKFSPMGMTNSLLAWNPWGRPDLLETGRFTGESAQLDAKGETKAWVWAAWKRKILVSQVDWPVVNPPDYILPNALARASTIAR